MASSFRDDFNEIHYRQGSCDIILKPGDLLNEKNVDALVIPTPSATELNVDSFVLFKSMYSQANQDEKREIEKIRSNVTLKQPEFFPKNRPGYIFAVPPYMGNAKKACKLLKETYTSCLDLAINKNCRKIAFPTIGCGIIGFELADATRCVYSALETFCESKKSKNMDEIRIVIFNQKIYKEFTDFFKSYGQTKKVKFNDVPISRENPNLSEMSSGNNRRQPLPQIDSRAVDTANPRDDGDDDDDTAERNRRGARRKQASELNPNTPEFQPSSSYKRRVLREFLINDNKTQLIITQGDVLTTKVDAIVNAANESMLGGGGVDGIIHKAAGDGLYKACQAHKEIYPYVRLPTGHSRILLSYNLKKTTHYIINTAGPCYEDFPPAECRTHLNSCYETSLALANLYDLETIAFTAISCGIFGYPVDEGAEVALTAANSKAGALSKIWFVLKDDHIYDAWIKAAKNLKYFALGDNGDDDNDEKVTITFTHPTAKEPDTTKKSNTDKESRREIKSPDLKIIDGSTPDDAKKPALSNHEKSSKKSSTDQDAKETHNNSKDTADHDSSTNENNKALKEKSEQTNNDKHSEEQTTSNSPPPAQKDQQGQSQATANESSKSQKAAAKKNKK
ncbi:unnamed protein product [Rotaria magnacalcarata]|uniref:Macro domain-containing protein n=2 Tax=Rotaria magnacalcarata TaxID=392030 RepID=A0A815YT51_9BILA|nr:unnamed protein product [Rotaria magnacalcarata]